MLFFHSPNYRTPPLHDLTPPWLSAFGVLWAAILFVMFLLAREDIRDLILPDRYNGLLFLLSLCHLLLVSLHRGSLEGAFLWAGLGILCLSLPLLLFSRLLPGSFGGGDVKLAAAAGPLLGPGILWGGLLGLLLAGGYGLLLLLSGHAKKEEVFPLGPFLLTGFLLALR